jgi:hypothetical protein
MLKKSDRINNAKTQPRDSIKKKRRAEKTVIRGEQWKLVKAGGGETDGPAVHEVIRVPTRDSSNSHQSRTQVNVFTLKVRGYTVDSLV